jgi:hypothetical protein
MKSFGVVPLLRATTDRRESARLRKAQFPLAALGSSAYGWYPSRWQVKAGMPTGPLEPQV